MAYGTPSDPVAGTVITVAWAVSNVLDPIRWLRLLTGNADPPGSSYVVVSDSTTGTTWRKIPSDAIADNAIITSKIQDGAVTAVKIADGVIIAALGYTPINRAGDSGISGNLSSSGHYITSGNVFAQQLISQIAHGTKPLIVTSQTLVDNLNAEFFQGLEPSDFLLLSSGGTVLANIVTTGHVLADGHVDAVSYVQGSQLISDVSTGTAPIQVTSTTKVDNLNVAQVDGKAPGSSSGDLAVLTTGGKVALAVTADAANAVADGVVSTAKLANGAVTAVKIADGVITGAKMVSGTVTGTQIAAGAVDTSQLADGGVSAAKLGTGAAASNIGSGGVSDTMLASGAAVSNIGYTPARIASGTYTGNGSGSPRQITTGFVCKLVFIIDTTNNRWFLVNNTTEGVQHDYSGSTMAATAATLHASNGFTLGAGSTANVNLASYEYVAFG